MQWFKAAEKFNEALASSAPTPGGGAAAAMTAAMGCSLSLMAAQTTALRKTTPSTIQAKLEQSIRKLHALNTQLNHLIQEDSAAYTAYLVAKQLPKENPMREANIQQALVYAAQVPTDTATTAIQCLREIDTFKQDIAPVILSDIYCSQHLLKSALQCCIENIRANTAFITNETIVKKFNEQIESFLKFC